MLEIVNIRDVEIHLAAITCLRSSTAPWKHAIKVSSHIFNLIFDFNLLARILTRQLFFFLSFHYSTTVWQISWMEISKLLPETVLLLLLILLPQALIWLYSCWQMLLWLLMEVKQLLLQLCVVYVVVLAAWILWKGSHFWCVEGSFIGFVPHMGLVKRMIKNSCFLMLMLLLSCILAFELRRRNSNWWSRSGLFVSYGLDFPCELRLRWSYLV